MLCYLVFNVKIFLIFIFLKVNNGKKEENIICRLKKLIKMCNG